MSINSLKYGEVYKNYYFTPCSVFQVMESQICKNSYFDIPVYNIFRFMNLYFSLNYEMISEKHILTLLAEREFENSSN